MSVPFFFSPALSRPSSVKLSHLTSVERQAKGGEKRTSLSKELFRSLQVDYLPSDREAEEIRQFFDSLGVDLVRFPDWVTPAKVVSGSEGFLILSGFEGIDFRVHTVFLIKKAEFEGLEVGLDSYDPETGMMQIDQVLEIEEYQEYLVFPVRVGRFSDFPKMEYFSDRAKKFDLTFEESVSASINKEIPETPLVSSNHTTFLEGRPVFEAYRTGESEAWESNLNYIRKGFGLESGYSSFDEAKRIYNFDLLLHSTEISSLISFFHDRRGRSLGFWLSTDQQNYKLATPASVGDTQVLLDGPDLPNREGYVYLNFRVGSVDNFYKIASSAFVSGLLQVTLSQSLSDDFKTDTTSISLVSFVRFSSDQLSLSYQTDQHVRTQLSFLELPKEYETAEGVFQVAYLYEFGGYSSRFYTSHELDLSSDGRLYEAANLSHRSLSYPSQSIRTECVVSLATEDQSDSFFIFRRGFPLEEISVSIYEVSLDDLDTKKLIFSGKVSRLSYSNQVVIDFFVGSSGDSVRNEVPTVYFEKRCSRRFLSTGCNLDPLVYQVSGLVDTISGISLASTEIGDESTTRGFPDWFLLGRITIGTETRTIVSHNGDSIKVSTPFLNASPGDEFTILPGCNRTQAYCVDRFNNFVNFGGFPFVPPKNPQLEAVRFNSEIPVGGKK